MNRLFWFGVSRLQSLKQETIQIKHGITAAALRIGEQNGAHAN